MVIEDSEDSKVGTTRSGWAIKGVTIGELVGGGRYTPQHEDLKSDTRAE